MKRLLMLVLLLPLTAHAQERIDLPTRPGVTQPVYVTAAASPVASVVVFPGGSGIVGAVRNNFLLRIVPDLVAQGFTVAVADVPSDMPGGMPPPFRAGPAHARDIAAIVAMLQARAARPVWLIGTSRGSISAANGAAGRGVAGVVLTSSVWRHGMALTAAEQIKVPVLIVHNRDDGCSESPPDGVEPFRLRLTQARLVRILMVSGGTLRSEPCQALSPHGYLGIEAQVVPLMAAFIRGQ